MPDISRRKFQIKTITSSEISFGLKKVLHGVKDTRLLYNQLNLLASLLIYMIVANLYVMQNVEKG